MYGSVFNQLMDNSRQPEPKVGDGATELLYSDRHAGTIVEIVRFKSGARKGQIRSITVQRDKATRTDNYGMSDSQDYSYERDPEGGKRIFKADKGGRFHGLLIGHRQEYFDYSF